MKILIVDDDPLVRESLKLLLSKKEDMTVIGTSENGLIAINTMKEMKSSQVNSPDVVLMDIQMPEMDGIEATGLIKKEFPETRVMMLTTFKDEHSIRRSLLAGAEGYLIKSTEVSNMAVKIRALFTGTVVMDQKALEELTKPKTEVFGGLTPREQDIVRLVGEGFSNKEISKHLFISEGTVRNNLSVILEKMNLRDRTQLAILYLKK
ncbi:response regulator [Alkalibaculum sp. M08DMB]|uniref:Stage 0 sporulation protein A homolog n=1 Tax=Alkalibaculum sporogenes TaxID=2655001 RepID=A0A6A7K7T6_9FIRM|nr:response regulator [Alkalibaculum sporogenes]